MTTIAWDGDVVAADRGSWVGSIRMPCQKLFKLDLFINGNDQPPVECIIAIMGCRPYAEAMVAHLQGLAERPSPSDYDMDGTHDVAFIWPKGQTPFTLSSLGVKMRVHSPMYAGGGGREFAMGALTAGASAVRAVELTSEFTDYAAHGVDLLRHA